MTVSLDEAKALYAGAETFTFGDSRELCDELLALVRSGQKTATCDSLAFFERTGEVVPAVGRCDIALDWDGNPAIVTETQSVEVKRFCDVDEAFALAEGENDSLEGWRRDHQEYFERSGAFDPEMEIVCERFRLVRDFARDD
ncbi:MAG: ASCH domain-containing protein [Pseudomonadota bacterium]